MGLAFISAVAFWNTGSCSTLRSEIAIFFLLTPALITRAFSDCSTALVVLIGLQTLVLIEPADDPDDDARLLQLVHVIDVLDEREPGSDGETEDRGVDEKADPSRPDQVEQGQHADEVSRIDRFQVLVRCL